MQDFTFDILVMHQNLLTLSMLLVVFFMSCLSREAPTSINVSAVYSYV